MSEEIRDFTRGLFAGKQRSTVPDEDPPPDPLPDAVRDFTRNLFGQDD